MSRKPRVWACCAAALVGAGTAQADPALPTIPAGTFTVGAATGNAATDTASLNAALTLAKNAGGGTVVVPAGTYVSNALSLSSNINLQLSGGATIRNNAPLSTLITAASNSHDVEISGSGTIDGHASNVTSSNNLVSLQHIDKLLVSGVTIANSSHEHLVIEADSNVTVNSVTINDAYTLSMNKGAYLQNTDGIDFSGSHFLITGTTVSAGDDDIVAKPGSTFTSDITITNNFINAGHGISVGGQTNAGLNGMSVSNITFNGTQNGLRLKAGQGQGGTVQNVSFNNITMTNVTQPIIINSWYQSGDKYGSAQLSPSLLHNTTNPGETVESVDQGNNTPLNPFFDNIRYSNISATGATENAAIIYGLDSISSNTAFPQRNIDDISFSNVSLSGKYGADIYYVSNLDLSGLHVTATGGNALNLYGNGPLGDATGDGEVDVNDLSVVLGNLGRAGTSSTMGNFDGAATVDLNDLNDVLNHLGMSSAVGATAALSPRSAPEPTTVALLGMGGAMLFAGRGGRWEGIRKRRGG